MRIQDNQLIFSLDANAGMIEKKVYCKSLRTGSSGKLYIQGRVYVHKQYIGKNCLLLLKEPRNPNDQSKTFDYNGRSFEYYEMLIRDVKSTQISTKYQSGVLYLPPDWADKMVTGIIFE